MTKTDIGIYRGLKEKFDPEVHVGFYITTDTEELLIGDKSLGLTISGGSFNDGVLTLNLNSGKDIEITIPEATKDASGLLSAWDKVMLDKVSAYPSYEEFDNLIRWLQSSIRTNESDISTHREDQTNPHQVTKAQVGLSNVTNDALVKRSEMGVANGVATLDADGKVPASLLPSYVDDIIDVYATYTKSDTGTLSNVTLYLDAAHTQLVTGEAGKIYQNIANGEPQYQFRWTGTIFSLTGASSLILGEVTGTAYDGAKGKANADNIAKIKRTLLSHIKDTAPITTAADKVSINYECYEGNLYGAAGTDHTADIPAATTAKAGVMSAADKTKLDNLAVADEEDLTVVNGKIKLKDRTDTTKSAYRYKILRCPENSMLTLEMMNDDHTIYEIRYNFHLNRATITIPSDCILKFSGGRLSNGTLKGTKTAVIADGTGIFNDINLTGTFKGKFYASWFLSSQIRSLFSALECGADCIELEPGVTYAGLLKYTENGIAESDLPKHMVACSLNNRKNISIIGNGATITETLIENDDNKYDIYDVFYFTDCQNINISNLHFNAPFLTTLSSTGWTIVHMNGRISNFNVDVSGDKLSRAIWYGGTYYVSDNNLSNSIFNAKVTNSRYGMYFSGGKNLNIFCDTEKTDNSVLLSGVQDSKISVKTIIQDKSISLLNYSNNLVTIPCSNLDLNIEVNDFELNVVGNKNLIEIFNYSSSSDKNYFWNIKTNVEARFINPPNLNKPNSLQLIQLNNLNTSYDTVKIDLTYNILGKSVTLINRGKTWTGLLNTSAVERENLILNASGTSDNEVNVGISPTYCNGDSTICLDSCNASTIAVEIGSSSENSDRSFLSTVITKNCSPISFRSKSDNYTKHLARVIYDNTTITGTNGELITQLYPSWERIEYEILN